MPELASSLTVTTLARVCLATAAIESGGGETAAALESLTCVIVLVGPASTVAGWLCM